MPRTPVLDLLPRRLDLRLYAGDGVGLALTVAYPDGDAVLLNGVLAAQIRASRRDSEPLATFAVTDVDAVLGEARLTLTGEQTAALVADTDRFTGVWDAQWTPEDQQPRTLVGGKVICELDVTRL